MTNISAHLRAKVWGLSTGIDVHFHIISIFLGLNFFHREERTKEDPKTPEKFQMCSTRSWVGQIKNWRRKLHVWDPPSEGQEYLFSSSSQRYLESTLYFCRFYVAKRNVLSGYLSGICMRSWQTGLLPILSFDKWRLWCHLIVQVLTNSTSWCNIISLFFFINCVANWIKNCIMYDLMSY